MIAVYAWVDDVAAAMPAGMSCEVIPRYGLAFLSFSLASGGLGVVLVVKGWFMREAHCDD